MFTFLGSVAARFRVYDVDSVSERRNRFFVFGPPLERQLYNAGVSSFLRNVRALDLNRGCVPLTLRTPRV